MSGRKYLLRPLSVFKPKSRASKLLALLPPVNAVSDVESQTSSDEDIIDTNRQEIDELSSDAPSIPSSLENLYISDSDEERNNISDDEIPNSEPENEELAVPLTPIISQVLPSTSQMLCPTLFLATLALVSGDVSHLLETTTTPEPPPKPYLFSYSAGRYPGHIDRTHTEVSDGSGVVKGSFSYVDPRQQVRTVDYVADKQGFHPVLSDAPPDHPTDSESVAQAKNRHYQLYAKIAEDHATHPHPDLAVVSTPVESRAVAAARQKHAELFRVIAEQHARIAAERDALLREEEHKEHLQDLQQ